MRNILWRGDDAYERKLSELYRAMAPLVVQPLTLQVSQKHLRKETKTDGGILWREPLRKWSSVTLNRKSNLSERSSAKRDSSAQG